MNETLFYQTFLQPLLGWLALVSLITFALSLVLIPLVVGRLAEDCFIKLYHDDYSPATPSFAAIIWLIMRNILGLLLVLAGLIMLFLPGQGLLTILLGTLLVSFPGKRRLLNSLVVQPKLQHSMDWLRKKRGTTPFIWPEVTAPVQKADRGDRR